MPITLTRCHVSGANVTCVTDLEGDVVHVVCPYFDEPSRTCSMRAEALTGGPLTRLLEQVAEDTVGSTSLRCALV